MAARSASGSCAARSCQPSRESPCRHSASSRDLSIHEIAVRAGFALNTRLSEVFRRDVGMSPSEFRGERNLRKA